MPITTMILNIERGVQKESTAMVAMIAGKAKKRYMIVVRIGVEAPATVRGQHPQRGADAVADEDRAETDGDRDARTVDDAREDVAPEVIGAEEVVQTGSDVDGVEVLVKRILQWQDVGEDGAEEVEADPRDADPEEQSQRLARLLLHAHQGRLRQR